MKILLISKNGREIIKAKVTRNALIIGRSPSCDIVLRAPNVKPVHYLVEWVGTGTFDQGDGAWSIFDVSGSNISPESKSKEQGTGGGVILGSKPVEISGFEFKWTTDRLMETSLEGGSLSESFVAQTANLNKAKVEADRGLYLLEVVSIRSDSGSVSSVEHISRPHRNGLHTIPQMPEIKFEWHQGRDVPHVNIHLEQLPDVKVYEKGSPVIYLKGEKPSIAAVNIGGLLQVHWQLKDHYFRLVPKVPVPPVELEVVKDRFYITALAGLISAFLVLLYIVKGDFKPAEKIAEPPRIARIEVKEIIENPPLEKPQDKVSETPQKQVPLEKDTGAASAARFKTEPPAKKPQAGLNAPAPKADVNTIGLLGALKSKNEGSVKADMVINEGIVSKTISGAQAPLVLQQPPSGRLGNQNKPGSGLTNAGTTLKVGDSINVKGSGPIAAEGGKPGFNIGYEEKGNIAKEEFSAEGGLDKESIRRTLAAYKKEIRTCYETALVIKPKIKGRIVYKWQITPLGPVKWVQLMSSGVDSPNLTSCVQEVITKINFPKAANGQPTVVIYPFEFLTRN